MRKAKEIKENALEILSTSVDKELLEQGFKRNKRSFVYKLKDTDHSFEIHYNVHTNPPYDPGSEAHIYPRLQWKIPQVSEVALSILNRNEFRLANCPEILLNHPIDWFAPKEFREDWYVMEQNDYLRIGIRFCEFAEKWLYEFITDHKGIDGLLKVYETCDPRIIKQEHWYIYVIAAYLLKGKKEEAISILEQRFSKTLAKKMYPGLHDNVINYSC